MEALIIELMLFVQHLYETRLLIYTRALPRSSHVTQSGIENKLRDDADFVSICFVSQNQVCAT